MAQARFELLEERQHTAALQLLAEDDFAVASGAVDLEDVLRDVEADRCWRVHALLLRIMGRLIGNHVRGALAPGEEPSTASLGDVARLQNLELIFVRLLIC